MGRSFSNRAFHATCLLARVVALCSISGCGVDETTGKATLALDVTDCPPGTNIIEGTGDDDTIMGTSGADCIFGYGGDDSIDGLQGEDFIVGGGGSDELRGGNGSDRIVGDDGDDVITGGNGGDTISGGDGNDIISGDNGPDDIIGGAGNDVILDSRGPAEVDPGEGTDSCSTPRCELPAVVRCVTDADCPAGRTCTGGACVYCLSNVSCDDGATCTGVEECVPAAGCMAGMNLPAGYDLGIDCTAGIGGCERTGPLVCDGSGGEMCTAVPGTPRPDVDCDAADDDCDSVTDEAYLASATSCGIGACARTGVTICMSGAIADSCMPGLPGTEVCNGMDDDCDGATDEGGLADDDGDTICDAVDACPFHPDVIVTAAADAVIVRGRMLVNSPSQVAGVPAEPSNALSSLTVRTDAFGGVRETLTDCEGNFAFVLPVDTVLPTGSQNVAFRFQGDVPGPGGITSEMVVVDDVFDVWGAGPTHIGWFRTTPTTLSMDARGRTTLTFDSITIATSEAELFRIGVGIIDDFHRVTGRRVPGGRLAYMRRAGVLFELTPYTNFDYVDMTATVLDLDSMDTPRERERVLLHESAHVFRHVLDGDRTHFDGDSALFTYLTCHTGFDIFSEGYAFNEGWAQYWRRSRRRNLTAAAPAPASLPWPPPPRSWTFRDPLVVVDPAVDPWGGEPR